MTTTDLLRRIAGAIFACVFVAASVLAQEVIPPLEGPIDAGLIGPPTDGPAVKPSAGKQEPAAAVDTRVPDISGTWVITGKREGHVRKIVKCEDGTKDFTISPPWQMAGKPTIQRVKWSPEKRCFVGSLASKDGGRLAITTVEPLPDGQSLKVVYSFDEKSMEEIRQKDPGRKEIASETWKRPEIAALPQDRASDPSDPEPKTLLERIRAQESAAAKEAESIRRLLKDGKAAESQTKIVEHQRTLEKLLATLFDLKAQLDQTQIKELRERLHKLEQQIEQRQQFRDKIIQRHAEGMIEEHSSVRGEQGTTIQVIDVSGTRDPSTPQQPPDFTHPMTDKKSFPVLPSQPRYDAVPEAGPIVPDSKDHERHTLIHFKGPSEMNIECMVVGNSADWVPALGFDRHPTKQQRHAFWIRKLTPQPSPSTDFRVYGTMDVYPAVDDATTRVLNRQTIPVTFTAEELKQVAAGKRLLKIAYLKQDEQTLVSTHVETDEEAAIEEAGRRGKLLVVLRLAHSEPALDKEGEQKAGKAVVHTDKHRATIDVEVDEGSELVVFTGKEPDGWLASSRKTGKVAAVVESSSAIRLEDGSLGKGFIVRPGGGSTVYVALTPDGPIPFGEFVIRANDKVTSENGTHTFADIRKPDGELVPVSFRVRTRDASLNK